MITNHERFLVFNIPYMPSLVDYFEKEFARMCVSIPIAVVPITQNICWNGDEFPQEKLAFEFSGHTELTNFCIKHFRFLQNIENRSDFRHKAVKKIIRYDLSLCHSKRELVQG